METQILISTMTITKCLFLFFHSHIAVLVKLFSGESLLSQYELWIPNVGLRSGPEWHWTNKSLNTCKPLCLLVKMEEMNLPCSPHDFWAEPKGNAHEGTWISKAPLQGGIYQPFHSIETPCCLLLLRLRIFFLSFRIVHLS